MNKILLICIMLVSMNAMCFGADPEAPSSLKILDCYEQLGIDKASPRFSWHVNDADRGERQTAYRLIAASTLANIHGNTGDKWDSGKVSSTIQSGVEYGGTALESRTKYYWKVMTWDKDGNQSAWSTPATFVTGYLTTSEWTASWIKASANTTGVPYLMRKSFTISKTVSEAYAYICGVGQFELSLNGAKVGDHQLDPAWSEYTKECYYVTFDVSSQLKSGENAVGVYLADGWMDLGNPRDGPVLK